MQTKRPRLATTTLSEVGQKSQSDIVSIVTQEGSTEHRYSTINLESFLKTQLCKPPTILACLDNEYNIKIYNVNNGRLINHIQRVPFGTGQNKIQFLSRKKLVVCNTIGIQILDVETSKIEKALPGNATDATISYPYIAVFFTHYFMSSLVVWNIETDVKVTSSDPGGSSRLQRIDNETFAVVSNTTVQVWSYKTAKKLRFVDLTGLDQIVLDQKYIVNTLGEMIIGRHATNHFATRVNQVARIDQNRIVLVVHRELAMNLLLSEVGTTFSVWNLETKEMEKEFFKVVSKDRYLGHNVTVHGGLIYHSGSDITIFDAETLKIVQVIEGPFSPYRNVSAYN